MKPGRDERAARAGPGRPKDAAKRAAVLAAARDLFLSRGFEATTLDGVAAVAGVSKMTVYGHFGDKDALLGAVVEAEVDRITELLSLPPSGNADLGDALRAVGAAFLGFVSRPEVLAFDRLLASEARRRPELARAFFEAGPGTLRRRLAARLAAARGEDRRFADPEQAAEHLLALWLGLWLTELRLELRPPPDPDETARRVDIAVDVFLRAFPEAPGTA